MLPQRMARFRCLTCTLVECAGKHPDPRTSARRRCKPKMTSRAPDSRAEPKKTREEAQRGAQPLNNVRHLVSKKKRRFIADGLDLDLSYADADGRIIAVEAAARNPASSPRSFMDKYHPGQCKVYNLCMEPDRVYSPAILGLTSELVERHGTYDQPAAARADRALLPLARALGSDAQNVAIVHCKAGKGRTGTTSACTWCGRVSARRRRRRWAVRRAAHA